MYDPYILATAALLRRNGLVIGDGMHLLMQNSCPMEEWRCHLWCPVCHVEHRGRLAQAFHAAEEYRCECGASAEGLICIGAQPFDTHLVCAWCGKSFIFLADTA
jgi:hypothetical protein